LHSSLRFGIQLSIVMCMTVYICRVCRLSVYFCFVAVAVLCAQAYFEAEEILMRVTGRLHISVDRLYLNLGIAHEEAGDWSKAYDSFYKWYEVCRDLYGSNHTKTRRPISTLHESAYRRIAEERGVAVPSFPDE
jgi:hypothetical protein